MVGAGARKNAGLAEEATRGIVPLRVVDRDVSDAELASLYSRARALLMPSFYEGFGLPALEAMACGTPVLASMDPALVEVCGGAAEHLDIHDPRAWRQALVSLLAEPSRALRMREAGMRRAAAFTWENTARLTRSVYEEALALHG
jgi:glycosyltransferase involved in cell wall biosynthesis